ncbi:hypothetical protein SDC9_148418 [bioreactor metagenome]|uniref:Uncharacterized protein n=1 Tax=bioreactor metagenome TaxID=1076179 RepID=A0A645EIW4_9ZZZZ
MSVRTAASPDQLKSSPIAAITKSALRATDTASAILPGVVPVMEDPSAKSNFTEVSLYFSMSPLRIGTLLLRSPRPAHSPFRLMESFIRGPISATVFPLSFVMGSSRLSFFRSTTEEVTAFRAVSINSGVIVFCLARSSSR